LVKQLAGILLLAKRHGEKLNDRRLTQLQCQISRSGVGCDFVVLNALSSTNQREVRRCIILRLALAHNLFALLDQACHPLARLGAGRRAQNLQAFVQPLDLRLSPESWATVDNATYPLILVRISRSVFTSVCLVMEKPEAAR